MYFVYLSICLDLIVISVFFLIIEGLTFFIVLTKTLKSICPCRDCQKLGEDGEELVLSK